MDKEKLDKAVKLCRDHNFEEARKVLDEAIREDKTFSDAWRLAAQIDLNEFHDVDKAYDELIEALRLAPKNVWALLLMGNLLLQEKKDVNGAKQYYSKILEYYPDNAVALSNVAAVYAGSENYDDAMIFYAKSLEADKTYAVAYYGMAACYYNIGEYRKCFDTCHKAVFNCVSRAEDPSINGKIFSAYVSSAKKLAESADYKSIIDGIVNELQRVDHLPIKFREDNGLKVAAKLEYGPTHGKLYHTIVCNQHQELFGHLCVHELMHLKMLQKDTIEHKGKVLMMTKDNEHAFVHKYYSFFNKAFSDISQEERRNVLTQACEGVGTQILNCPLDLFIEQLIYDNYPDVQPIQFLSLLTQNEENAKASSPEVKRMFPPDVMRSNTVMNLCTSLHLRELYGISGIGAFNYTNSELAQAKDLFDEFKAYLSSYKTGDEYELVEYFGEALNMEDYYTLDDEYKYTKEFDKKKAQSESEDRDDYADEHNARYALEHQDGADPQETMMMAMYMETAMEHCDSIGDAGTEKLARECAVLGYHGISPNKKYVLHNVSEKPLDGYFVIACYYVSFARKFPKMLEEIGLPYTKAYSMALRLYNNKKKKK